MIDLQNVRAHVLLVDDNKEFTEVLCDYLRLFSDDSIDVMGVASNGCDAIDMIALKQPDIVILDIIMPRLDGIGVLKKVHDMDNPKKPLFIMLSAVGQSKIIEEAMSLDAVYYIEKPFDLDILVSKIKSLRSAIA
jgi:two-component system response regulator (stage 0 sporulation protein A)